MENKVEVIKKVNNQEAMDSRDVAKMIGKRHRDLMRDIRRYINDMATSAKLRALDFFIESTYEDAKGETRECYLLTKQGCEFVANKLTGKKGTIFTATYVGLFNEYQKEHNEALEGHLLKDELAIRKGELEYHRDYLIQMERQNANNEVKNLISIADRMENRHDRNLILNEALNKSVMPVAQPLSLSATNVANQIGTSPYNVGKWGQMLGLKAARGERGRYGYWQDDRYYYNEDALRVFLDHRDDILGEEDY
ncbi:Rha family transcriptional regulator [Limosilactobacillus fermentum]|uniref:Rha family transcriptional regulator n=1 Tax=Limosilactobacillus fermentum TaxID=1613 RepID=UPI0021A615FA|nr:Rha family transcriptional regulator [Limosilactobacillus fermentum]MCT3427709.1 phage regulatory protein [Limosilactobacillus fermentum]